MNSNRIKKPTDLTLKVVPIGGCGEFGMNMTLYIWGKDAILVDSGIMFPSPQQLGINGLYPDVLTFLKNHQLNLIAYVITHGHEDHIGSLPYVFAHLEAPVFATPWTRKLIEKKFFHHKLSMALVQEVAPHSTVEIKDFTIDFFPVNHSILDACSLVIEIGGMRVFHTGDFKFDPDPYDAPVDFKELKLLGEKGIDLLLADSTNAIHEGIGKSEKSVQKPLEKIIKNARGRIIITTFASNFWRIRSIIDVCKRLDKTLVLSGRGIVDCANLADSFGYLPKDVKIVDEAQCKDLKDKDLIILSSGSQAESRSNMARIAKNEHKHISIKEHDTVIFSSRIIPGNERSILAMIDDLKRLGANVITPKDQPDIHVSGHAYGGELKKLIKLLNPNYYVPVHGTFSHLQENSAISKAASTRTILISNGDWLTVSKAKTAIMKSTSIEPIFVDQESYALLNKKALDERLAIGELGAVFAVGIFKHTKNQWLKGVDFEFIGLGAPLKRRFVQIKGSLKKQIETLVLASNFTSEAQLNLEVEKAIGRELKKIYNKKPAVYSKIHFF